MNRYKSIRRCARRFSLVISVLVTLSIAACGGLQITHRDGASIKAVPGVPFYAQKARCRQEVIWFEPIFTLTLAALVPDKDGTLQNHPKGTVVLSRSNFQSEDVTAFIKLLNNQPSDEGTIMRSWTKVAVRTDSNVFNRGFDAIDAKDRVLIGRSVAPVVYVDYSDQYYANAKIPVSGSANLDAKVASDGTLSELSGQIQNNTVQTILSALPISSLITGGLGIAGSKSIANPGDVESFQLSVSTSGYTHTLARLVDYPASGQCPATIDITFAEASEYKRENANGLLSSQQGDGAADNKQDKSVDPKKQIAPNSNSGKP